MTHRKGNRFAIFWMLILVLAGALIAACKPNLPPVEDCRVGIQICRNDQGHQCAGTPTRFFPLGDYPCGRVNAVCQRTDAGATCVRIDGGVDVDAE